MQSIRSITDVKRCKFSSSNDLPAIHKAKIASFYQCQIDEKRELLHSRTVHLKGVY